MSSRPMTITIDGRNGPRCNRNPSSLGIRNESKGTNASTKNKPDETQSDKIWFL